MHTRHCTLARDVVMTKNSAPTANTAPLRVEFDGASLSIETDFRPVNLLRFVAHDRRSTRVEQRLLDEVDDGRAARDRAASLDYARRMHFRYLLVMNATNDGLTLCHLADGRETVLSLAAVLDGECRL